MGKEAEESQDKDGRNTSQIRSVRWQQQAEWRRTGINFAETSGQQRPDEEMIREEEVLAPFWITLSAQVFQASFFLLCSMLATDW